MKSLVFILLILSMSACTHVTPKGIEPDGIIRHYIRSNSDGSDPEHVVHFRPSRTDVAVYKWVEKCETAAYVTAQMDPETFEPLGLHAGKVAKDGHQARFGRIDFDPATRLIRARADLPDGSVSDQVAMPVDMPWFLFDYDLGDLNAYLQEKRPQADFAFAWALVWPNGEKFLTNMATVRASHRGIQKLGGRAVRRFDLQFVAGKAGSGTLFTDPVTGAIVEAQASVPNHPGYHDYLLKLEREDIGGTEGWNHLLKGHYADCPA